MSKLSRCEVNGRHYPAAPAHFRAIPTKQNGSAIAPHVWGSRLPEPLTSLATRQQPRFAFA